MKCTTERAGSTGEWQQAGKAVRREAHSRRKFLKTAMTVGATFVLPGRLYATTPGQKTFTILHSNDMHSAFIGLGPSLDYTAFKLNDDRTRGGFARLSALIARLKAERKDQTVLLLDAGDYSMGTAFGAATREIGGELRLMGLMGYDATTFGNHEFDYGPEGLGQAITVAAKAGLIPAILAANTNLSKTDTTLSDLQLLAKRGVIKPYQVIERGGLRFGIFGVIGKEAIFYTNGGKVEFTDAIEAGREMVRVLRDIEHVDVIIALSHGGVLKGADGRYTGGDDVRLAEAVPGIDVVIGGHSHTELHEAIMVGGRTPVVQTGKEGRNLGELVLTMDGKNLKLQSYRLHPIDDSIAGDPLIANEIEAFKTSVNEAVFASRGYSIDQPLALVSQDLPNTFTDIAAGTLLANLTTDSFRNATKVDIGFTVNGLIRTGLTRGARAVQTVYDVFAIAPLGFGVVDTTAGSALVTAYFTGLELKHLLEYFLVDNPAHPGEYFPRASGMRFHYDMSRPQFDVVTAVEIGTYDKGYRLIDITGKDPHLYSITCPLMLGVIIVAIPQNTKGKLSVIPKNKSGQVLTSRVDALETPKENSGYLLPPPGQVDKSSIATESGAIKEIKEWQAIMDHISRLPIKGKGSLPTIPVDERAAESRAIKISRRS